jgi:integrase
MNQTLTPELQKLLTQLSQHLAVAEKPSELNLLSLWSQYKIAKAKLVAATTQKGDWTEVDRVLNYVSPECLEFSTSSATLLLAKLLERYAASTTKKVLLYARAANYWGIEEELLSKNFYSRLFKNIPKSQKDGRTRKCFEKHEIEHILAAFASNEFVSKFSVFPHSHYHGYVQFLALTGFRPEEAIALTWADIKNGRIIVSRAYSQGILKETKTYESRNFPINSQLDKLLNGLPKTQNLVFPSPEGGYINQHNFGERYWKPIVKKLVATGTVGEYLPTYNLRHSWITRMLRANLDIATVAKLAGNKADTIMKHYLAAQVRDLVLPEF